MQMQGFTPYRDIPKTPDFSSNDVLVVFGELFSRGYANGIVDEAEKAGMKVIYSTVGRRDENDELRALTADELKEKTSPLINIPLEAGFDMTRSEDGTRPIDQMKHLGLKDWHTAKFDWEKIEQSHRAGVEDFKARLRQWTNELKKHLNGANKVVFVHTMAGGVPRSKVVMPPMNRVFKGHGARYTSSEEFWNTDIGKLCQASFEEVTANTFGYLVEETESIRKDIESKGGLVSYVAYGYHGNEVLIGDNYQWQSYSPYLQGFAKLKLEDLSKEAWEKGIKTSVFNAPEILTNSSSIFLGIEVALYPLLGALRKEGPEHPETQKLLKACDEKLKPGHDLNEVMKKTEDYFNLDVTKKWTRFDLWPQHNGPEQMENMRNTSTYLLEIHKDQKDLLTANLSEIVFNACGKIMLSEAAKPREPVWWIGHDAVAKAYLKA